MPRERIHVIPNAIDAGPPAVADPGAARAVPREAWVSEPDDLVALFVGHN